MIGESITLLSDSSILQDNSLIASLEEIASLDSVMRVIGLVDLHLKLRTENPSSVVIATERAIIPKLSSVAQNCGMSLIKTSLRKEHFTDAVLDEFISNLRSDDNRIMAEPELDIDDIRAMLCKGARAVIDRYGLPIEFLDKIEFQGVIGDGELIEWSELKRLIPISTLRKGLHGFGIIPSGNHFLEVQYIDEIINRSDCEQKGLDEHAILIMIHSDGGLISDDIGNMYGNRTTLSGTARLAYSARKLFLHINDFRGFSNWMEKWKYYFGTDKYIVISPNSYEGERFLAANKLSMNAGYAARLTTIARIDSILTRMFGQIGSNTKVLCDFSHNSILQETIGDRKLWLHRHNASRVKPGQLVFLPGYDYTSSCICMGDDGAIDSLYTMDHGAGKTIDYFKSLGLSKPVGGGLVTRKYSSESCTPEIIRHYSDEGLDKVIEILSRNRIVRPIAKLRPIAGYRFEWKGRFTRLIEKLARCTT